VSQIREPPAVSFHLSLSTDPITAAYPDEPLLVAPHASVGEVMQLMRLRKSGSVLVLEDSPAPGEPHVIGIFTERDTLTWLASHQSLTVPIRDAMTASPQMVDDRTSVGETIEQMSRRGYRHLPIVSQSGQPSGVAGVRGIVHYLVDHFPGTIYNLPPQPGQSPQQREGA
jgi:CBS domain-containing protein